MTVTTTVLYLFIIQGKALEVTVSLIITPTLTKKFTLPVRTACQGKISHMLISQWQPVSVRPFLFCLADKRHPAALRCVTVFGRLNSRRRELDDDSDDKL